MTKTAAPTTTEIWRDGFNCRVVAVDGEGIRVETIVPHNSETEFARYVEETETAFRAFGLVQAPTTAEPGLVARWRKPNLH